MRIAWWNAGLSPPLAREVPTKERYRLAKQVVRKLVRDDAVDLLCLGEVSEDDLKELAPPATEASVWHTEARGLAVVYGPTIKPPVRVHEHRQSVQRALSLTTGVTLHVEHQSGAAFQLMLAHWPSRLIREQDDDREEAARMLRDTIAKLPIDNVIVAGDFNDEPFDKSLTTNLQAYRERRWVREAPGTPLYNPFWRLLGEKHPLEREATRGRPIGTCSFRGRSSRWAVYDQILFGRTFLGGGDMTLIEDEIEIWHRAPLYKDGEIAKHFDHLPVLATVSTP